MAPKGKQNLSLQKQLVGSGAIILAAMLIMVTDSAPLEGRLAGFAFRIPITLDSSKVALHQMAVDFPLHLDLQAPALKTQNFGGELRHPQGYDVRFTAGDVATHLLTEVVAYDPQQVRVEAWVNLDTLLPLQDHQLYLYFGSEISLEGPADRLGERQLQGYYYSKKNGDKKKTDFSKEWLALEKANQKDRTTFVALGEVEDVSAPLPYEFDYFKSSLKGKTLNLVEWGTAFETDNDYFELQKSLDAKTFETISTMGGGDQSPSLLRYSYADMKPEPDGMYYRLKQVNNNGWYTYTLPIYSGAAQKKTSVEITGIQPNPFLTEFEASFQASVAGEVTLQLFTSSGSVLHEEVLKVTAGPNTFRYLEGGALPPGEYVLALMGTDNQLKVAQLIKGKGV
ncbi:MAG: hypothetical protein AAF399_08165 [Bacteroidota bacterium]